ncbi:MAG TPA: DedA family protein [Candidatus Paceibacterota bacterium]
MEQFSIIITELFFALTPLLRGVLIFLFAYGEGLPVIGSILPGGTIALLVGSLSVAGFIAPWSAVLIITIGSFLGDMTGFFIGKKFKHWKWVQRLVVQSKHQKSWDLFDRHLALIVIFGKLIPVVRSTPSFFAGARNVKVRTYIGLSFVGSMLWAVVGIYGGNALARVAPSAAIPVIVGILIISGIAAVVAKRHNARKKQKLQNS